MKLTPRECVKEFAIIASSFSDVIPGDNVERELLVYCYFFLQADVLEFLMNPTHQEFCLSVKNELNKELGDLAFGDLFKPGLGDERSATYAGAWIQPSGFEDVNDPSIRDIDRKKSIAKAFYHVVTGEDVNDADVLSPIMEAREELIDIMSERLGVEHPDGPRILCWKCNESVLLPRSDLFAECPDGSIQRVWAEKGVFTKYLKFTTTCPSCRFKFHVKWYRDGRRVISQAF